MTTKSPETLTKPKPGAPLPPALGSEKEALVSLAYAAKQVCEWTRHNEYPQPMTAEFMRLTDLIDQLDTEVRRVFPNTQLHET